MDTQITPLAERIAAKAAIPTPEATPFDLKPLRDLAWRAHSLRPALRDENGKYLGTADPRMPEDLTAADFAAQLTYTDRASYLAWVAEWKAAYAELSAEIRNDKARCRELQRSGDLAASSLQAELASCGTAARMLLALRRVAKADSWARRNAAGEA